MSYIPTSHYQRPTRVSYVQHNGGICCFTTSESHLEYIAYFTTITQPSHPPYYCFTSGTITHSNIYLWSEVSVAPDGTVPLDIIEYTIPLHSLIHYGVAEQLSATYHNAPAPLTIPHTTPQYPGA